MIRKNPQGDIPVVHPDSFIDPTAIICGKVIIKENVFVGPYAVIRADEVDENGEIQPITIGAHSNIQDGVIIHSRAGASVLIGEHSSIAHRAIIHGPCTVGDEVFIGFNTVLYDCTVGNGCVIRHNSVIDGAHLPDNFYVPSTTRLGSKTDLTTIPKVSTSFMEFSESVAKTNNELVLGYKSIQNEL